MNDGNFKLVNVVKGIGSLHTVALLHRYYSWHIYSVTDEG